MFYAKLLGVVLVLYVASAVVSAGKCKKGAGQYCASGCGDNEDQVDNKCSKGKVCCQMKGKKCKDKCLKACTGEWEAKQGDFWCKGGAKKCCVKASQTSSELDDDDHTDEGNDEHTDESIDISCEERYGKTHTACLDEVGELQPMSNETKQFIIDMHNKLRAQEKATNMLKLKWDDESAKIAGKWATNCEWKHDAFNDRSIRGRMTLGQNLMYHSSPPADWARAINAWHVEKKDFKFGIGSINGKMVGHYTQLVWAESGVIGCNLAKCPKGTVSQKYDVFMYACNYGPSGNVRSQTSNPNTPYKQGKPCADCRSNVDKIDGNKICGCSGACKLRGKLDPNTCDCACLNYGHIEKVNGQCELNCGKAEDHWYCGSWPETYCAKYFNVELLCPNKCKLCTK